MSRQAGRHRRDTSMGTSVTYVRDKLTNMLGDKLPCWHLYLYMREAAGERAS